MFCFTILTNSINKSLSLQIHSESLNFIAVRKNKILSNLCYILLLILKLNFLDKKQSESYQFLFFS